MNPVKVVPKKTGSTVVRNQDNKLILSRVNNGWCMCIDYYKLHFPFPFIDQLLECLANKILFFLVIKYNTIVIASES